jgi:hypothetical protein
VTWLEQVSMGKYSSKLYHNGLSSHSNSAFGILTMVSVFFIFYGSWALLKRAFVRDDPWVLEAPDMVDYTKWSMQGKSL